MRSPNQRGLLDRAVGACFALLAGAAALFFAVKLIAAVIVPLLVIVGITVMAGLGLAVVRARRNRW